jgi:ABC-type sugar transport system permease subunit
MTEQITTLPLRIRFSEWLDRHSRQLFITPAVVLILIFSIFPLVASLIIAFSRIRLRRATRSRIAADAIAPAASFSSGIDRRADRFLH